MDILQLRLDRTANDIATRCGIVVGLAHMSHASGKPSERRGSASLVRRHHGICSSYRRMR